MPLLLGFAGACSRVLAFESSATGCFTEAPDFLALEPDACDAAAVGDPLPFDPRKSSPYFFL
jgi:hypothetical protein